MLKKRILVSYNVTIGINAPPVGMRQRIGSALLAMAQCVDKSRTFTATELVSIPAIDAAVRDECLRKGWSLTQELFKSEVREAAGEAALRMALPQLFADEAQDDHDGDRGPSPRP